MKFFEAYDRIHKLEVRTSPTDIESTLNLILADGTRKLCCRVLHILIIQEKKKYICFATPTTTNPKLEKEFTAAPRNFEWPFLC